MKVLVAYATRHGATAGIADHIAATLAEQGLAADSLPVEKVTSLAGYDAVVLGGAAYILHWLRPAVKFAKKHRAELRSRPVWLFSSGPLGTDLVDDQGRNVLDTTRPKEFDALTEMLQPRGEQVFFGAFNPDDPPIGVGERLVRKMPTARDAMPTGDFRDWPAIAAWARQIATELTATPQ